MSAKLNVDIVAQLKDFNKAMTELKSEVGDLNKQVNKGNQDGVKSTNALSGAFSSLGKTMGGLFAADMLLNFGSAVIATTAEFQKMEAVLTTTLGSKSAAKVAMDQIVEFASSTPFQVNELTDSFVKLANRGFTPTLAQMNSLGDLASSTGKSFDQLTEAALDAMTGEFERLKEFGIRASSEGDKVKFTFKGVTTEVQKTDEAIKDYLISLGNAEGVSGSMAAISETVGGQISNLEDNFSQLQLAIGSSSSGLISSFLNLSNTILSDLVTSLNSVNTVAQAAGDTGLEAFGRQLLSFISPAYAAQLEGVAIGIKAIEKASVESEQALQNENAKKEHAAKISAELAKQLKKEHDKKMEQLQKEEEQIQKLSRSYEIAFEDITFATKEYQDKIAQALAPQQQQKPFELDVSNIAPPAEDEEDQKKIEEARLLNAEFEKQKALGLEISGIFGPMIASSFTQMFETGKFGFASLLDGLKKMAIQLAATAAAAFALNILLGGVGMAGFGKGTSGFKNIFGKLGGGGPLGGLIPFANGGIVSGPTSALVGEYTGARTNPEVIAPLSKLQNMMGGNVTFTISGDNLVGTLNRANKTRARKF
jgi:hypothetical protein